MSLEQKMFLKTLETLVNHLMPQNSPLVLIMNKVYWTVRDVILVDPVWPDSYYGKDPITPQEILIRSEAFRKAIPALQELYDWTQSQTWIPKNEAAV